jgi:hypothetical protein
MDLNSIAQVNYDQLYPNATEQTSIKVEHFIEEAKSRYAWEMFRISKETKRAEGEWEIPSALFRQSNLSVVDNEADISDLKIFRSFDGDIWVGNLGGLGSDCNYIRQSVNQSQMLLDDEYIGNGHPYTIIGKKILFPRGTHKKTIPIIYASNGEDLDGKIEVDDAIGALVSDYIYKKFSGKLPEDRSADSNTNTP